VAWWEVLALLGGGLGAGVFNTMAGGGSSLTVPLLVIAGVPGNAANGSNRIGILTSNLAAVGSFRRLGVDGLSRAWPHLAPIAAGSLVGSYGISRLTDDAFETLFGLLLVPIVLAAAWPSGTRNARNPREPRTGPGLSGSEPGDTGTRGSVASSSAEPPSLGHSTPAASAPAPDISASVPGSGRLIGSSWPPVVTVGAFFAIGVYGGAIQAGLGLLLLAALNRSGLDLVVANSVKAVTNVVITALALPVFIVSGHVRWAPALVLAVGFTLGGWLGAPAVVRGGERWIRAAMVLASVVLAARLLGLLG